MPEAIDETMLTSLTVEAQAMIKTLQGKGTTTFSESAATGMLRVSMINLIGDLQFHGVLPRNLHAQNGQVIRHLGFED